jgi:ribose transport system substrate-binding protein
MSPHRYRWPALALAIALTVAACGGGTETPGASPSPEASPSGAPSTPPASAATSASPGSEGTAAEIVASLPKELAILYDQYAGTVTTAAYRDFQAPARPWKICESESYQGNPWRVAVTEELKRLAGAFQSAGLVSGFEMTDANGDVALQITHIQSFIDKGCDLILVIAASATGLDQVIESAYRAGIPVISFAGAVTSPYAINVDSNFYRWGYDMMKGICDRVPQGRFLAVDGIAGHPIVAQEGAGRDAAHQASCPGLEMIGPVNGDWTPTTTKNVVLQTLATNPSEIDAVWTTGSETRLVTEAFVQSGRPAPLVTGSISGDALGYWHEHPDGFKFYGHAVLPIPTAQTAFRVGVRILEGQKPLLNTLLVPLPEVTQEHLADWFAPCMTPDSGSIFPVPPSDPLPEDLMNAYFDGGAATPPFNYADTPKPCG